MFIKNIANTPNTTTHEYKSKCAKMVKEDQAIEIFDKCQCNIISGGIIGFHMIGVSVSVTGIGSVVIFTVPLPSKLQQTRPLGETTLSSSDKHNKHIRDLFRSLR